MRYVTDMKAGKMVSAFVILNKKGEHVATVRASYADSGGVLVNVFNYGMAVERTAVAMRRKAPKLQGEDYELATQHGAASGYGYDKFHAALSGLYVDGHRMSDNCGHDDKTKALYKRYEVAAKVGPVDQEAWDKKAEKIGARFSNYRCGRAEHRALISHSRYGYTPTEIEDTVSDYPEFGHYSDLYRLEGLSYLRALGYNVIQAI